MEPLLRTISRGQLLRRSVQKDPPLPAEEDPGGRYRRWTSGDSAANLVLAGFPESELGEQVPPGKTFIGFSSGAAESAVYIRQVIEALSAKALTRIEASRRVDSNDRSRLSKLQSCISPAIDQGLIASETMNVDDPNAIRVEWKRGVPNNGGIHDGER